MARTRIVLVLTAGAYGKARMWEPKLQHLSYPWSCLQCIFGMAKNFEESAQEVTDHPVYIKDP